MDKLFIDAKWGPNGKVREGMWVIVEAYSAVDPTEFTKFWNEQWVKQYTTALFKQQWGAEPEAVLWRGSHRWRADQRPAAVGRGESRASGAGRRADREVASPADVHDGLIVARKVKVPFLLKYGTRDVVMDILRKGDRSPYVLKHEDITKGCMHPDLTDNDLSELRSSPHPTIRSEAFYAQQHRKDNGTQV
jgi:hypothetical protein